MGNGLVMFSFHPVNPGRPSLDALVSIFGASLLTSFASAFFRRIRSG
jgi:hypothetical protein